MPIEWTRGSVTAAGAELRLMRAGKGSPVVVLHRDIGTLEQLSFYDALAERHDVIIPIHPGYSEAPRPDWVRGVRDIAVLYRGMLDGLGLSGPALVGLGFGGWIAAEMATMAPANLSRLVLVGPMGVKPPQHSTEWRSRSGFGRSSLAQSSQPVRCPSRFLSSSMAEHPAVNRRVAGSSPARGAKFRLFVDLSTAI